MTNEELLKPRYKVIAKHSPFDTRMDKLYPIGFIIHTDLNLEGNTFLTKTILEYPHIFKPLEWWEEREESELPKYLKSKYTEAVSIATKYFTDNGGVIINESSITCDLKILSPATEAEYNEFKNKKP